MNMEGHPLETKSPSSEPPRNKGPRLCPGRRRQRGDPLGRVKEATKEPPSLEGAVVPPTEGLTEPSDQDVVEEDDHTDAHGPEQLAELQVDRDMKEGILEIKEGRPIPGDEKADDNGNPLHAEVKRVKA